MIPSFNIIITSQQGCVQPADRADRLKKRGESTPMFPFITTTTNPTASHVPMLDNLLVPIQKGWEWIQTHVQPVVQHLSTPWCDIQGSSWQVPTPSCTHTSPESQTMGSPIQNPIEGITTWCQGVQQWVANQTANSPPLVPASSGLSSTHPTVGDPLLATNKTGPDSYHFHNQ